MVWFAFKLVQIFIGTSGEFCALPGSHDLLGLLLHSCRFLLVLLRNFVHSPEVTICLVCLYTRVGFNWYSRGVCGLVCLHTRVGFIWFFWRICGLLSFTHTQVFIFTSVEFCGLICLHTRAGFYWYFWGILCTPRKSRFAWFSFTLVQVFIGTSEEFCALPVSHDLLGLPLHSCRI